MGREGTGGFWVEVLERLRGFEVEVVSEKKKARAFGRFSLLLLLLSLLLFSSSLFSLSLPLTGACDIICWARLPPLPLAMATTSGRATGEDENRRGGKGAASGVALLRREIELSNWLEGFSRRLANAFRECLASRW